MDDYESIVEQETKFQIMKNLPILLFLKFVEVAYDDSIHVLVRWLPANSAGTSQFENSTTCEDL